MREADVVVAGCGVVGLAVARRLAAEGLAVVALAGPRGACRATPASFGWANASTKLESERYHRLNAAGLARLTALADRVGARAAQADRAASR